MAIDKISAVSANVRNISFRGSEGSENKKPEIADEEKSNSMAKKVGLCALGAIILGGGIIYYVKKGRAPKTSGANTSSVTTNPLTGGSGGQEANTVKKIMRKLKDGTEVLRREETRDKDGHLVKIVRYRKDGKTVKSVSEYKFLNGGVTDPSRNVLTSLIRYGENNKVVSRFTANADFSGFKVDKLFPDKNIWRTKVYSTQVVDGEYKHILKMGIMTNAKTGIKIRECEFVNGNGDDIRLVRTFDKKTGKKVIHELEVLSPDTYQVREFGEGKSRRVTTFKGTLNGDNSEMIAMEQYDKAGRLRKQIDRVDDNNMTTTIIDKKGRKLVHKIEDGEEMLSHVFNKNGHEYQQYYHKAGCGFNIFRDGEQVGRVDLGKSSVFTNEAGETSHLYYDDMGRKARKHIEKTDKNIYYDAHGNKMTQEQHIAQVIAEELKHIEFPLIHELFERHGLSMAEIDKIPLSDYQAYNGLVLSCTKKWDNGEKLKIVRNLDDPERLVGVTKFDADDKPVFSMYTNWTTEHTTVKVGDNEYEYFRSMPESARIKHGDETLCYNSSGTLRPKEG